MQWVRSLLAVFRSSRRLVGTDLDGNKYYEVISGRGVRPRREVITKLKHEQYEDGTIPVEWEAWIRRKRDDPPSHDELISKLQQRKVLHERVKKVEEEETKMRAMEQEMATKIVGHASAPVYKTTDLYNEPTRTGKTFQPGPWNPRSNTTQAKKHQEKDQEKANGFEPESWTPGKMDRGA